jgi:hypothetical protein
MPKKPAEKPKQTASFAEIVHNSPQLTTNPYQSRHFQPRPGKRRKSPTTAHKPQDKPEKEGALSNDILHLFAFTMLGFS